MKAAYIHIPFCEQICYYCDFNKFYLENQPVEAYLDALQREVEATLRQHPHDELKTIFIGGGTPTSLSATQLENLLEGLNRTLIYSPQEMEFTVEANPGDLTMDKLTLMKNMGVNRLSLGVQTFHDPLLEKIGRTHRSKEALQAVEDAKKAGYSNISIDLMYGLPGQTMAMFEESIVTAGSLDIQHVSSYSLQVEPKTVFYNLMRAGKLSLPPEDTEADMYETLMERMAGLGFFQYEISNFAKKGFESRHNLTYWANEEYYGFGAGAHSYLGGKRKANAGPLNHYLQFVNEKGTAYIEEHTVTEQEKMEEELFLGLRRAAGIRADTFLSKYGRPVNDVFGRELDDLAGRGLIKQTEEGYTLTKEGRLLGNEVFQAFLK
ncbi:radical SAM family heme chaperone HemW [Bacillus marinisedimentorum]|uniref:radical SAM family heme chaperone HemW n=1 Tax=Bacillus marinisedimentorum TaxID=1821260 RepID=UPI0008730AD2|nr:radical SAM family heme chaperone HemW [Bacillus marinisedimentorum]